MPLPATQFLAESIAMEFPTLAYTMAYCSPWPMTLRLLAICSGPFITVLNANAWLLTSLCSSFQQFCFIRVSRKLHIAHYTA